MQVPWDAVQVPWDTVQVPPALHILQLTLEVMAAVAVCAVMGLMQIIVLV